MSDSRKPTVGPCPFCHHSGGKLECDFDGGMLFHTLPVCETFNRLTADEFVKAVIERKHVQ